MKSLRQRAMPVKTWGIAALCALWIVAWPGALLESTRGLRGILDLSRDRGAYDLVAILYRGSDLVLYLWLFMAVLVVFRLILELAVWLDEERRVPMAMGWALRVHSVRWSFVLVAAWAILVGASPDTWRDALSSVAIGLYFVPLILSGFIASHPQTLVREKDVGGWRPYWPGMRSILVIAGLSVLTMGVEESVSLVGAHAGSGAKQAMWIVAMLLETALDLAIAAVWFGYWAPGAPVRAWRALARWSFLRVYFGGYIYVFIAACLLAAPLLTLPMVATYIGPQYDDMARTTGQPLPEMLQCFLYASARFSGLVGTCLTLPFMLSLAFAERRLVFREGLSGVLGPDARIVDGAGR